MIIEINSKKDENKKIIVKDKVCHIGTDSSCQVQIKHSTISAKHIKIEQDGSKLFVTDISDSSGVMINNIKLEPRQKTIYLGHYPLEIGPGIQISVKPSEVDESKHHISKTHSLDSSFLGQEKTNSKIRKNPLKGSSTTQKIKKDQNSNVKKLGLMLLVCSIGAWYYFDQELETEIDVDKNTAVLASNKSNKVSLPNTDLSDIFNSSLCESEQEKLLCSVIYQNIAPKEGVKITNEGVFVFFKMDEALNQNNQIKLFESLSLDKKFKFTLASLFFKEANLKSVALDLKIHLIGFDTFSDIPTLRAYMRVERSSNIELSDDEFKTIFSYVINAGIPRYFDEHLGDFISFKKL